MRYHLAAFGCAHLGYSSQTRRLIDGVSPIVYDGYIAHEQIIKESTEWLSDNHTNGNTVLLDLGDLFHSPKPSPRDIRAALSADAYRLSQPNPPLRLSIPGNHDRVGAATVPATALLEHRSALAVIAPGAPNPTNTEPHIREVIVPGYYEVWNIGGNNELYLHMINEQALSPEADKLNAEVDPQPRDNSVNILCTHGIVPDFNGTVAYHHGGDERGGERMIPLDWFNRGFSLAMLADYHTPSAGSVVDGGTPHIYTGSAVRRGWSDSESPRGWSAITVENGEIDVDFHETYQRRSIDHLINAKGMTVGEIRLAIDEFLESIDPLDERAGELTGDSGATIRVIAVGVDETTRIGLMEVMSEWRSSLPEALRLLIDIRYTEHDEDGKVDFSELPDLGRESLDSALSRMVSEGKLRSLETLDKATREQVVNLASAALNGQA